MEEPSEHEQSESHEAAERQAPNSRIVHRAILEEALRPPKTGRDLWDRLSRGEKMVVDFDRSVVDDVPRPAELD